LNAALTGEAVEKRLKFWETALPRAKSSEEFRVQNAKWG
jgi:hypothetical protein